MRRGRITIGGVVLLSVLALGASAAYAAAGGPATHQGYPSAVTPSATGSGTGTAGAGVAGAAGAASPAQGGGSLPFTGLQLALVVLVGLSLVGGGIVLRTSGRRRSSGS